MLKHGGWQWHLRSVWPWVLVVCFLLFFGPSAGAQNLIDSEQSEKLSYETSLNASLIEADQNLQLLLLRLGERKQQVSALQASLAQAAQSLTDSAQASAELEQRLKQAEISVVDLQQELRATLISLAGARTQYDMLSEAFGAYVGEMAEQKRELINERDAAFRQARLWKIGALAGGGLIIAGAITVTVLILVK
jgi:septal ring factor EnvC (AmiA/AmiB activator)